jgi:hypothetical protein
MSIKVSRIVSCISGQKGIHSVSNSMLGRLGGSGWVEYLIVVILGVLCAVAISYDYSLSQFMHWDDGMWVGQSLLGQPRPYPPQPLIYVMMDALAPSVALVKALPLIAHGLLVGAIFLLLRQFSQGPLLQKIAIRLYILFRGQRQFPRGQRPSFLGRPLVGEC